MNQATLCQIRIRIDCYKPVLFEDPQPSHCGRSGRVRLCEGFSAAVLLGCLPDEEVKQDIPCWLSKDFLRTHESRTRTAIIERFARRDESGLNPFGRSSMGSAKWIAAACNSDLVENHLGGIMLDPKLPNVIFGHLLSYSHGKAASGLLPNSVMNCPAKLNSNARLRERVKAANDFIQSNFFPPSFQLYGVLRECGPAGRRCTK